jgi:hypothetical protein
MSKKTKNRFNQISTFKALSKEEQQDPIAVLHVFFDCYHLKDMHEVLWDWLEAALSTDSGFYDRGRERSNLIFLYKKLETLVEAAYILHLRQAEKKKNHRKKKRHIAL